MSWGLHNVMTTSFHHINSLIHVSWETMMNGVDLVEVLLAWPQSADALSRLQEAHLARWWNFAPFQAFLSFRRFYCIANDIGVWYCPGGFHGFWGHTSTGFLRTLERKREFWHFQMISSRATEVTGGLIYGAFAHSIGVVFCRAFTTWSNHGQLAANDICTSQIKSARFCVFLHANPQWLKYDTSWRSRISWELKYNMCFI